MLIFVIRLRKNDLKNFIFRNSFLCVCLSSKKATLFSSEFNKTDPLELAVNAGKANFLYFSLGVIFDIFGVLCVLNSEQTFVAFYFYVE